MDGRGRMFPHGESSRSDKPILACEIGEYFHLNSSITLNERTSKNVSTRIDRIRSKIVRKRYSGYAAWTMGFAFLVSGRATNASDRTLQSVSQHITAHLRIHARQGLGRGLQYRLNRCETAHRRKQASYHGRWRFSSRRANLSWESI